MTALKDIFVRAMTAKDGTHLDCASGDSGSDTASKDQKPSKLQIAIRKWLQSGSPKK